MDETEYSRHLSAYADYHRDVQRIPSRYPLPGPLTIGQLDRYLDEQGPGPHVSWHDGDAPFEVLRTEPGTDHARRT